MKIKVNKYDDGPFMVSACNGVWCRTVFRTNDEGLAKQVAIAIRAAVYAIADSVLDGADEPATGAYESHELPTEQGRT